MSNTEVQVCRCGYMLRHYTETVLLDLSRIQPIPDEYLERPFERLPIASYLTRVIGHWMHWLDENDKPVRSCPSCLRMLPDMQLYASLDQHPTAHVTAIHRAIERTGKFKAIILEKLADQETVHLRSSLAESSSNGYHRAITSPLAEYEE
jgi:hypothetical protein